MQTIPSVLIGLTRHIFLVFLGVGCADNIGHTYSKSCSRDMTRGPAALVQNIIFRSCQMPFGPLEKHEALERTGLGEIAGFSF